MRASILALLLNSSPERFWVLPDAMVPMLSTPGLARASASNSPMVLKRLSPPVAKMKSK